MELTYTDICIAVITALFGIIGIWRGFVRGFLGLVGLLVAIFLASSLREQSGELFAKIIYDFGTLNSLVGFIIVLFVTWILSLIVASILAKIIHFSPLGIIDKIFGLIFEGAKAFVLISIIVFGIGKISALDGLYNTIKRNSVLFPIMDSVSKSVIDISEDIPLEEATEELKNLKEDIVPKIQEQMKDGLEKVEKL